MKCLRALLTASLLFSTSAIAETPADMAAAIVELEKVSLGGTFRHVVPNGGTQLPLWACPTKETLVLLVQTVDVMEAAEIGEKNCKGIAEAGRYTRCGKGGFAFPNAGGRLMISQYCRVGSNAPPVFIVDALMKEVKAVDKPQDCAKLVAKVAQLVEARDVRPLGDDGSFSGDLGGQLAGSMRTSSNGVIVTCEPHAEPIFNAVMLDWKFDAPPELFFQALSKVSVLISGDDPGALEETAVQCAKKALTTQKEAISETKKSRLTCGAFEREVSVWIEDVRSPVEQ